MAVGQESIVTDALEAVGQDVEEKAANELVGLKRNGLVDGARFVVLVGEGDLPVLHADKAMIRDGDAVGVAGQVIEDGVGAGKRRFGIHNPLGSATGLEESSKGDFVVEGYGGAMEIQGATLERFFQGL